MSTKLYQENKEGKEQFTNEVIVPIARQAGYSNAKYTSSKDGEKIYLFQLKDFGCGLWDSAVDVIDVTADSCLAMVADVMKKIY